MGPLRHILSRDSRKGQREELLPTHNDGPPDSRALSGICPRCGVHSSFDVIGSLPVTFDGGRTLERDGSSLPTYSDQVTSLICRHCHQGVVVVEEKWIGDAPCRQGIRQGGQITWRGFHWWPNPGATLHEAVPSQIRGAFNEAVQAISANCPRAGAVMARRTLEAITVDKGESKGTLQQRLQALTDRNLLLPTLADWAKEVRLIGNAGAHFDPIEDVSQEDARHLANFIRELVHYMYVMPHELNKRRREK